MLKNPVAVLNCLQVLLSSSHSIIIEVSYQSSCQKVFWAADSAQASAGPKNSIWQSWVCCSFPQEKPYRNCTYSGSCVLFPLAAGVRELHAAARCSDPIQQQRTQRTELTQHNQQQLGAMVAFSEEGSSKQPSTRSSRRSSRRRKQVGGCAVTPILAAAPKVLVPPYTLHTLHPPHSFIPIRSSSQPDNSSFPAPTQPPYSISPTQASQQQNTNSTTPRAALAPYQLPVCHLLETCSHTRTPCVSPPSPPRPHPTTHTLVPSLCYACMPCLPAYLCKLHTHRYTVPVPHVLDTHMHTQQRPAFYLYYPVCQHTPTHTNRLTMLRMHWPLS